MNLRPAFATASIALAATFTLWTASGQTPAPAAPVPAPAAAPAPAASPPRLNMKPPARAPRVAIVDADARNCLEFPSNQEIIKCAEKYLHRRAG